MDSQCWKWTIDNNPIGDHLDCFHFIAVIQSILGFLWMSEEDLGFYPTIKGSDGQQFIEIERNGNLECIVIKELIFRSRGIVGRGTTCWRAYSKDHAEEPLVIKDSWQLPERDEEGEMVLRAERRNVINVARYYHHETVRVQGMNDDAWLVSEEGHFMDQLRAACTNYYEPSIPHVNKLRQKVFPDGRTPDKPDRKLYSEMIDFLREAQEDPRVLAE
ncbi:hypothetical protein E4U28_003745 [Claviceps purpurea]|nr:hypothetical protein E4U28_003745 [Claviceps purpurea]